MRMSEEIHSGMATQTPTLMFNASPRNNQSSLLYDSYELQAVLKQLNRAIQGTKGNPLSTGLYYMRSPYHRQHIHNIYKESAGVPKRISRSQTGNKDAGIKVCPLGSRSNKGFQQLWKKVKQRFTRSKRQ